MRAVAHCSCHCLPVLYKWLPWRKILRREYDHELVEYMDVELPNHEGNREDKFWIFIITSAKFEEIFSFFRQNLCSFIDYCSHSSFLKNHGMTPKFWYFYNNKRCQHCIKLRLVMANTMGSIKTNEENSFSSNPHKQIYLIKCNVCAQCECISIDVSM